MGAKRARLDRAGRQLHVACDLGVCETLEMLQPYDLLSSAGSSSTARRTSHVRTSSSTRLGVRHERRIRRRRRLQRPGVRRVSSLRYTSIAVRWRSSPATAPARVRCRARRRTPSLHERLLRRLLRQRPVAQHPIRHRVHQSAVLRVDAPHCRRITFAELPSDSPAHHRGRFPPRDLAAIIRLAVHSEGMSIRSSGPPASGSH